MDEPKELILRDVRCFHGEQRGALRPVTLLVGSPKRVMGPLANRTVVDIACGSLHCVVCTEDGKLFTWGDNDEGQIGNDSTTAMQGPQVFVTMIIRVETHLTDTPQLNSGHDI